MKQVLFIIVIASITLPSFSANAQDNPNALKKNVVVGLDNYYNNEWRMKDGKPVERFHYLWEDTAMSGYSKLGEVITNLGAELTTLRVEPTAESLARISLYIIVDPDTPAETAEPHYLENDAIDTIVTWVKNGGILVLFANNKGNSEFGHLNRLSANFGITFNEDTRNDSTDSTLHVASFDMFPDHEIFRGIKTLYIKGICTLSLAKPAEAIFSESGDVIMGYARVGKGAVFAVGDPWFYNEYIDFRDYDNRKAAENIFKWLLGQAKPSQR